MSNPLYEMLNRGTDSQNLMKQFQEFKRTFSGNPQETIQKMLNSGQISQQQVNQATQMAQQFQHLFK